MIYLDNAGTTCLSPEVLRAMMEFLQYNYANPSGIYKSASHAKAAVESARGKVAKAIGAAEHEVFFTGSGSEAINWAIKSIAFANASRGKHIITTAVEHPTALAVCKYLEGHGFELTYLPVDEHGLITTEQVKNAVRKDTILVSVMMANNEVGTIMPIKEIGAFLASCEHKVYFFTDAIQTVCHIPVDVNELSVDLLAVSGHKIYGPKGVGALYVRHGTRIEPLIHGGGQERGRRGGTENVAGIVGMGVAVELAMHEMAEVFQKQTELRDYVISQILSTIPYSRLNGHPTKRLPSNINITFEFIEGEGMLLMLDHNGFSASSGSACTAGSLNPSHVLLAMGLTHEMAHGSLRLTLGKDTKKEHLDKLLAVLPSIVSRLRQMSPLWPG